MSVRAHNRAAVMWDDNVRASTLTATSEAGDMVVQNLQTINPRTRWRSTDVTDQTIIADGGGQFKWNMLYIGGHNLTEAASLRVRISDNSDLSSPVYDVNYAAWASLYGLGVGGLGEYGLGGTPVVNSFKDFQRFSVIVLDNIMTGLISSAQSTTAILPKTMAKISGGTEFAFDVDDYYIGAVITITDGTGVGQSRSITAYNANSRQITIPEWATTPDSTSAFQMDLSNAASTTTNNGSYLGRYFGLTISDGGNSDGYIEAGVLTAGEYLQPEIDIDAAWEIGFVDPSERYTSYNYDLTVNERTKYRTASMTFSYLTESEADEFAVNMAAEVGNSKPVVIVPFFENTSRLYNNVIYGLLNDAPRKKQMLPDYTNSAYQVNLEIRGL